MNIYTFVAFSFNTYLLNLPILFLSAILEAKYVNTRDLYTSGSSLELFIELPNV